MKYQIKQLSYEDGHDIYEMLQDIPDGENSFRNPMYGRSYEEYKIWLIKCDQDSRKTLSDIVDEGASLDDGFGVPKSIFWLYANGKPVAMGKIRHYLTKKLSIDGGHVGYSVRKSARGKGHGKVLMHFLAKEAKKLGIDQLLLTIEEDNEPSKKVAYTNNGVLEKTEIGYCYIWIDCS